LLVDAVGDPNAVPQLLKQVHDTVLKKREAKMRTIGPDNQPIVCMLSAVLNNANSKAAAP
jgi:hypothetical protein